MTSDAHFQPLGDAEHRAISAYAADCEAASLMELIENALHQRVSPSAIYTQFIAAHGDGVALVREFAERHDVTFTVLPSAPGSLALIGEGRYFKPLEPSQQNVAAICVGVCIRSLRVPPLNGLTRWLREQRAKR